MNIESKKCKYCKKEKLLYQCVKVNGLIRNCCKECYQTDNLKKQRETDKVSLEKRYLWKLYYERNCRSRQTDYKLHMYARRRARKQKVPFDLKISDIIVPKFCPVLGMELKVTRYRKNDATPTLDRIIPSLGYVKENIRVISFRANQVKSNGTIEEHQKIIDYMKKHRDRLTTEKNPIQSDDNNMDNNNVNNSQNKESV